MNNTDCAVKSVKMTLARALKEKSRIGKRLLEARQEFKQVNSVNPEATLDRDPAEIYAELQELQRKYLAIRQAIARGNAEIGDRLTEMLVARAELAYYSTLVCNPEEFTYQNVQQADGRFVNSQVKVLKKVMITGAGRKQIMQRLENRLNELQDEVDEFNATHSIVVDL